MSFVARTCNGCEKDIYESCSHCMHNNCKDFDLCSTCMQGPPRAQHQHPEIALIRNPFSVSLADSGFKKNSTCDLCESSLSQSIAYMCFEERCHTLLCENCTEKSEHDSSHRVSCIQFPGARKMRVANSAGITDCHECECGISGPAYYCTEPECKLKYDSCETCMRRKAHPTSHRMPEKSHLPARGVLRFMRRLFSTD
ncbi:hypothetical protein BDV93DRAFT_182033 [Ceratobasidium sp. AG-I]|nr:hypothetical protein BDV93DRAFT_182033 [Ceratobasidium sp. AG-I]